MGPFYHDSQLFSSRIVTKSCVIHGVPSICHAILKMTTRLRVNCYLEISRAARERESLSWFKVGWIWVSSSIEFCTA